MYDDVESDFWKDIFVHMQHKNMVRTPNETLGTGNSVLSVSNAPDIFDRFAFAHPELHPETTITQSYATWEIFLTGTIKLRLFIQNGIKASLLQKNAGDLVKIADAKFHINPFPEIEEILKNSHNLNQQLSKSIEESAKYKKQQQLAGEFIKAILKTRLAQKDVMWNLKPEQKDFLLELENGSAKETYAITIKDYKTDLEKALSKFTS